MIIYNVTVSVDEEIHQEWLSWMKEVHIPDVMATGIFHQNRILKVLTGENSDVTFSIQYYCNHLDDFQKYQDEHAPSLQQEHSKRYGNRCVAFRTLLEVLD